MRVVFISGYFHPSQHRKVALLADAADVELLHCVWQGSGQGSGVRASANGQREYRVEVATRYGNDPHRCFLWPPTFALRRFRPDIIHCEYEQESVTTLEVMAARACLAPGTPLVTNSAQNLLRRRHLSGRIVNALTLRGAQHVTCWSAGAIEVLRQQGYQGGTTIAPIVGIDTCFFYPYRPDARIQSRHRLGIEGFTVGYVGRLVPEKGVDVLLQAAAKAIHANVHASALPINLCIVGSGPELPRLQALAQQLNIGARCCFVQGVEYDAMPEYMNSLDLVVLPSRPTPFWIEQFGRVLTEALACKTLALGADTGAIPEVLGDPSLIFPIDDADTLSRQILLYAADSARRQAAAEAGYRRTLDRYSVEQLAKCVLDAWRTLAGPAKSASWAARGSDDEGQ